MNIYVLNIYIISIGTPRLRVPEGRVDQFHRGIAIRSEIFPTILRLGGRSREWECGRL